jgi:hypothetical protein
MILLISASLVARVTQAIPKNKGRAHRNNDTETAADTVMVAV